MSRKIIKKNAIQRRLDAIEFYRDKYFNMWSTMFDSTGLEYQQLEYILKKLWFDGSIAAFNIEGTFNELNPDGELAFVPFAPMLYNIYDYPVKVNLVNVRGATFIPTFPMTVDSNVVICYALKSRKPIAEYIDYLINKIVNVEMLIDTHTKTLKLPFVITCSQEDKERLKRIMEALDNDQTEIFLSVEDFQSMKVLVNSNPYILDKLMQYKQERENEVLTYLGLNNNPIEKKERLLTGEVDSNNEVINQAVENITDSIVKWCDRIRDILGHDVQIFIKEGIWEEPEEVQEDESNTDE